ncbi:RdgB/HAM1 family non-canonical purine NTP pyrophosphatase [Acholeplasma granularum]|uniref:RdgB/HAM1 family non-canonical purine NTP pyrophosphatase n=1 Tax=Acholeplasma granularum TaxID=264635 RepID=UPI0004B196FB|nr:RdgB/HAM1 family non-canonical purine NTP pyrophosphatase [Acholeplasma granularum]
MIELIVASNNKDKVKELNQILGSNIFLLKECEIKLDVLESETTFEGNAALKAYAYAKQFNQVAIADDSGLVVEIIEPLPGIYSKRYSGLSDHENNIKLLDVLKNTNNRNANFICIIAISFPDGKIFTYEGKLKGHISKELRGINGFGYDPLFIPSNENKTLSELGQAYKNKHSHRSKALMKLLEDKDEIINYWRYSWKR